MDFWRANDLTLPPSLHFSEHSALPKCSLLTPLMSLKLILLGYFLTTNACDLNPKWVQLQWRVWHICEKYIS